MDIVKWGNLVLNNLTNYYVGKIGRSDTLVHIKSEKLGQGYKNIVSIFYKGIGIPTTFVDQCYSGDLSTFTRSFDNRVYKFENGKQTIFQETKTKFIKKHNHNIITV